MWCFPIQPPRQSGKSDPLVLLEEESGDKNTHIFNLPGPLISAWISAIVSSSWGKKRIPSGGLLSHRGVWTGGERSGGKKRGNTVVADERWQEGLQQSAVGFHLYTSKIAA